ncbi:putative late blight resistance protein-like protein R1B-14 [Forsythia ovata]|uniref:Late blight resistance protein-like protein R1B-14 n=1 Tax=Forsythia ovata TaxID=205694 RepID=A0ABD1SKD3_9LAMI
MPYAVVLSLVQILDQIIHSNRFLIVNDEMQQIRSLSKNLNPVLCFLEESFQNSSEEVKSLEIKIRDGAYLVENHIESIIYASHLHSLNASYLLDLHALSDIPKTMPSLQKTTIEEVEVVKIDDLQKIITKIDAAMKEVVKIKDGSGEQTL